jgi:hypothetical protein
MRYLVHVSKMTDMQKKILLATILVMTGCLNGYSQYIIKLTSKTNSKKTFVIEPGMRVRCIIKRGSVSYTDTLRQISTERIVVGDTTIAISDIKALGKRKKGTMLAGFLISGGLTLMRAGATDDTLPSCLNCQTIEENKGLGTAGDILSIVGGGALIYLGVRTLDRNSAKRFTYWKMEVIPKE